MRTSISKKLLAGALSVMMVLSLFAGVPANKAQAAASVKVTGKTAVYTGTTNTYKVVNLKKAQYVKVSVTGDAKKLVTVKKGGKKLATTKKVYGGKTITLKVANKKAAGKKYTLVVKAYKKGATKPFKTIKKTVTVYSKTTSVTLDQTEATLKVGETVTLTATKKPAKNTKAIKWTSSDETVATVADGVVTAVAAGTATIKATSGAKSATATITVEEAKKEAELVDLKVTGSKVLTATLSAAAEITAKDVVVKKGTVTLTPADVKVDGTSLVITLGSKISKDTYSVTYKEKTLSVEAEDEKIAELKTVGSALALVKDADVTTNTDIDTAQDTNGTNTVNAEIEYQALNQYGETMTADITSISSTFGGKANFTAPTAKKNGVISIVNINAVLGIAGTKGKVIIIAKNGVSTTNEVEISEEAKVAKIELKGIYNVATGKYVDAIPAEIAKSSVANYVLVVKAYNQYNQEIPFAKWAPNGGKTQVLCQSVSVANVLANVTVDGIVDGKLTAASFDQVTIGDEDVNVMKLVATAGAETTVKAGTFQIIVVGDRFGQVMNETVKVEQIDLIKTFTFSAPDKVYQRSANVMEFSAINTKGEEVKDFATLTELVEFDTPEIEFVKQTDGSAKLVYTPVGTTFSNVDNMKETTVKSVTATCNKISAQDLIVVPKTFTVCEDKQVVSVVKYTGATAAADNKVRLAKGYFVFEDQYGNTITSAEATAYAAIKLDYQFDNNAAVEDSADMPYTDTDDKGNYIDTTSGVHKLYVSIADQSNKKVSTDPDPAVYAFDSTKAQLTMNFSETDAKKATSLKVQWIGPNSDGSLLRVGIDAKKSDIEEGFFKVTGTVGGKSIRIPASQFSIVEDSYEPITSTEFTKDSKLVKKATAKLNVVLSDDNNKEYSETLTCEYEYSAADSVITALYNYNDWNGTSGAKSIQASYQTVGEIGHNYIAQYFYPVDQYGYELDDINLSFSISLGNGTTVGGVDIYEVKNPDTTIAKIVYDTAHFNPAIITVTASVANAKGISATQTFYVAEESATQHSGVTETAMERYEAGITAYKNAVDALDGTTEKYATATAKKNALTALAEAVTDVGEDPSDASNYAAISTTDSKYIAATTTIVSFTELSDSASAATSVQTTVGDALANDGFSATADVKTLDGVNHTGLTLAWGDSSAPTYDPSTNGEYVVTATIAGYTFKDGVAITGTITVSGN